jgi:hypothetical protein
VSDSGYYSLEKSDHASESTGLRAPKLSQSPLPLPNPRMSKMESISDKGLDIPECSSLEGNQGIRSCISFNIPSHMVNLRFQVKWSPSDFMRRQFGDDASRSIGSVIVLTGTSLNAQATTCREFMSKHWPRTSSVVLNCLENYLAGSKDCTEGT